MKFAITGIEKVRDVIEADDQESAEKLFRVRYPALAQITDVRDGSGKMLPVKQEFWQGRSI